MKFRSPAFENGDLLPKRFTCDGSGVPPPFRWDEVTPGTFSFILICEDPDTSNGPFTRWLLYNIPSGTRKLEEGLPDDEVLSMGARQGTNDSGHVGYGATRPARWRKHHYIFNLTLLDITDLPVPPGAGRLHVSAAMKGHVLDEAQITAIYQR